MQRLTKSPFRTSLQNTWDDIMLFSRDFARYIHRKLSIFGRHFETYKGYLVNLLIAKRGRYHGSFLNLSLFILVTGALVAAPYISSYYPTIGAGEVLSSVAPPSASVAELDFEGMSMATTISDKPRDQVVDYTVQSGDAISTIAAAFGVSEETIKWANNLEGKNPVLKPGQVLKIPPVSGIVHTVKRGETIYSIAKKYNTEAQNIVNFPFNDYVDLENFTLAVGQTLIVPDGIMPDKTPRGTVRPRAPEYIAKQSLGQFLWPTTGYVSQNPVWYHMALDIANKSAPNVFSAESGTVTLSKCYNYGYGCHVIVDHGGGISTLYAHLSQMYVGVGDRVGRGEALGKMGSTGRSTGTHLHFEVRVNGSPVNPWPYVK